MPRYRLTARSFMHGRIVERGEVVTLPPFQRPGPHMVQVLDAPFVPTMPAVSHFPASSDEGKRDIARETAPISDPDREFIDALTAPAPIPAPRSPGYLIVDTETNGFGRELHLASLALIFTDADMAVEHEYATLIRPDGWSMDPKAIAINGLTDERLASEGAPVLGPLHVWTMGLAWGRTVVAHNLDFDLNVMRIEMERIGMAAPSPARSICTMLKSRAACGKGKLTDAHLALCGSTFPDAHDAMADARACLAVLRALSRKGAL